MPTYNIIDVIPRPAERPRFSKMGHAYNSKSYSAYKKRLVELLKAEVAADRIRVGPGYDYAGINIDVYFPVPKSWTKKKKASVYGTIHRVRPDKDNIEKGIFDALQQAGVIFDDGQIGQGFTRKWYVEAEDAKPRIKLQLLTLDQCAHNDKE